jgi:anti-sigma B factor antagonist
MEVIHKEKNGIVCVTIKGRMSAEVTPELEGAIKKIVAHDKRCVLFDLEGLEYMRSPTLRVILKAVKQINQKRGKVALCSLNGYVTEIFEGNCFYDTFAIVDSIESGIQTLQKAINAA